MLPLNTTEMRVSDEMDNSAMKTVEAAAPYTNALRSAEKSAEKSVCY